MVLGCYVLLLVMKKGYVQREQEWNDEQARVLNDEWEVKNGEQETEWNDDETEPEWNDDEMELK